MKVVGRTIVLFVLAAALLKVEGQGSSSSDQQALIRDLQSTGLVGPLVAELGSLDQLQYLSLGDNMLNGEIPSQLGNLKNLIAMDLYNNALRGSIPSSFGSNLQSLLFLDISNNRLCGIAPIRLLLVKTLRPSSSVGASRTAAYSTHSFTSSTAALAQL
ncbi:Leucine-rich repeat protein 2 [Linum perenne]